MLVNGIFFFKFQTKHKLYVMALDMDGLGNARDNLLALVDVAC